MASDCFRPEADKNLGAVSCSSTRRSQKAGFFVLASKSHHNSPAPLEETIEEPLSFEASKGYAHSTDAKKLLTMNEPSKSIAKALSEFFGTEGDSILFAGAGVSILAGLPDWKGLLTQMAESIRSSDAMTANIMTQSIAKGRLTKAADYFWLSEDIVDGDKSSVLKTILNNYDSGAVKSVASLPFKAVLTTNFDRSILDAISLAKGKAPRDYCFGNATFAKAIWDTEMFVARIHGCIESPQSMILGDSQFDKLLIDDSYIELLTNFFQQKRVIFLGFSFYDPAIKYVFEQIEKKSGSAPPGRHLAILPSTNASELIQKAHRLNISVVLYDPQDKHDVLWKGVAEYVKTCVTKNFKTAVSLARSHSEAKQYLAACYARASVASEDTPLKEIVVEGILSAALQREYPASLGTADLHEVIRKSIGIKGKDVNALVEAATRSLVDSHLVRKHRTTGVKGSKFAWISLPGEVSLLANAIDSLTVGVCDRAHVQEGWKPPVHVGDVLKDFLKEIVHQRGWDLGAAFAAGKAPDPVAFRSVLAQFSHRLSAFDRERIERAIESLFQRPTEKEASILGELGRISFAVELAFQAPRTMLLHKAVLPQRVYFDTNLLLPAFVQGHPLYEVYGDTLRRLRAASIAAGLRLQLVAYSGYINEMISQRNAALVYEREAGLEFDDLARSDALYHGPGNINVYIGAYVNAVENGHARGFSSFLKRVAPYITETDLRRWLQKTGFVVAESVKNEVYVKLYGLLERANASKLSSGKQPILLEHDALQLSLLEADFSKTTRALFVTADRQLYEDVASTNFGHLTEYMVSHVGIVQLVDLLVGRKGEDRATGELLWSNVVSEKAHKIRSYLTVEALQKHDAGLAMDMHSVVEAQSDAMAAQLDRERLDLEASDSKRRIKALRSFGSLQSNFFAGMSQALDRLPKKSTNSRKA